MPAPLSLSHHLAHELSKRPSIAFQETTFRKDSRDALQDVVDYKVQRIYNEML